MLFFMIFSNFSEISKFQISEPNKLFFRLSSLQKALRKIAV